MNAAGNQDQSNLTSAEPAEVMETPSGILVNCDGMPFRCYGVTVGPEDVTIVIAVCSSSSCCRDTVNQVPQITRRIYSSKESNPLRPTFVKAMLEEWELAYRWLIYSSIRALNWDGGTSREGWPSRT